jgi:molecular chaperone HtpG
MPGSAEKFQFQAESKQILEMMIHSIYTHKEIFLRELVSNASDALDKLRIEALTNPALVSTDIPAEIRVACDKDKRTLTVSDTGIGMSREEVIQNIGTIARSGTRELVKKLKESKDAEASTGLIGQFGVGFYSVFMAADRVTLVTRRAGETAATMWESAGDGEFTVQDAEKPSHGTEITLHLKPADEEAGMPDFTDPWTIKDIVKRYSDFINYPVVMKEEREEVEKDAEGKPVKDGKKTKIVEDKTLNSMKPIWTKKESEVTEEEYADFYKHISHDWTAPLKTVTLKAEGTIEFHSLLFLPSKAPFDFWYQGYQTGLQLYVRRVMIMEHFEELLPSYLRFVKGVVESSDLPLNLSRETLQHDRHVALIKKRVTGKILSTLADMQEKETEKYLEFWKEFGNALKEGVSADAENKTKISELLLFQSTADASKLTNLRDYVKRMQPGQEEIYYLTGDSRKILENSPHLEAFKQKNIEVLFLVDPVDELLTGSLNEFDGKKLKSAGKGSVELGSDEEKDKARKERDEKQKDYADLFKVMQEKLSEQFKEVRLSSRLVTQPACIVSDEFEMSPTLEKLLKKSGMGQQQAVKRILEVNGGHPVLRKLKDLYDVDPNSSRIGEYAELLAGYAMIAEGMELPDPSRFTGLMVKLMETSL